MKNLFISIFALAVILSPAAGFGQDATSTDPGTTPDSPLYFLKVWKEQIQIFFTFGAENKAKRYLHLADVRLAEYERMIEKGKTEIAERTLEKYESQLGRALDKINELKVKNEDVGGLVEKVRDASEKALTVIQSNLEKAPEAAREGLMTALEAVQRHIDRVERIEEGGDNATSTRREAEEESVELESQNNSGESGMATLMEVGENLKVSLNLTGAPAGVTQPAHIHVGSCENLGAVKYALKFPVNGRSETVLEGLSLGDLKNEEPLAINVHKSTAEPGVYVACGDLDL